MFNLATVDNLNMLMFEICKKVIKLCKYSFDYPSWDLFKCDTEMTDLEINVCSQLMHKYGVEVFEPQPGCAVLKCQNALLSANDDWSKASITLLDGQSDGLEGALIAAIMTHLATRHGIMMHSSLVDVSGKGIMFIGPSGIGKTTQAELWHKYRDAVIINGDMALVHDDGQTYWGCGCPWHGSSPYCENRQVALSGIVVLQQDLENTIEKLDGIRMVERVLANVFLPHWYEIGVEAVMAMLDGLLSCVPVYLLKCRPDEELVERAILND